MKCSKIIPIYKKDQKSNLSNYRPVSILPILSKVFKQLFIIRLKNYFNKCSNLTKNQFGFQKGKCTLDESLELINFIVEGLEKGEQIPRQFTFGGHFRLY